MEAWYNPPWYNPRNGGLGVKHQVTYFEVECIVKVLLWKWVKVTSLPRKLHFPTKFRCLNYDQHSGIAFFFCCLFFNRFCFLVIIFTELSERYIITMLCKRYLQLCGHNYNYLLLTQVSSHTLAATESLDWSRGRTCTDYTEKCEVWRGNFLLPRGESITHTHTHHK